MAKFIANVNGRLKEQLAISTSAGSGDGSKIIQTDNTGKLDISLMPVGVGQEVSLIEAFENLSAGDFVNLFNDGGTLKARKADASVSNKPADGFVLSSTTTTVIAIIYGISQKNTQLSALSTGVEYFLSAATAGGITATAPIGAGNIVQMLGKAEDATTLIFSDRTYFELA